MNAACGGEGQAPDGTAPVAGSACLYCGTPFETVPELLTHERSCPLLEEAMTPTARRRPLAAAPLRTAPPPPAPTGPAPARRPVRTRLVSWGRGVRGFWSRLQLLARATRELLRLTRVEGAESMRESAGRWLLHGALAGAAASVLVLVAVTVLAART